MMKDSIILYTNYLEKFSKLSAEQFGELIRAILEYQVTGEAPELEDILVALSFDTVRPDIDRNNEKYDQMCQRNRENGRKGGRPRKEENPKKPSGFSKNPKEPTETDSNPNDNDNDYDNDLNIIVNKSNSLHSLDIINSSETSSDTEKSEDQKYQELIKDLKQQTEENKVDEVINEYKVVCTDLPAIQKVTKERRKKVKARLKTYSMAEIYQCFSLVASSDFLSGRNGKWKASFDWLFANDQNIQKVLEGNYANKTPPKKDFNNFDQREYDFSVLENKLLGG